MRLHAILMHCVCPPSPDPQLALGAMVNFFFSGFILGRVPFALSPKFRMMLQVRPGRGAAPPGGVPPAALRWSPLHA